MSPEKNSGGEPSKDLLGTIVNEVDDAREVLELARQLVHAIPLRSFHDIVEALGSRGTITFRGHELRVEPFAAHVPSFVFPIDSAKKLVALLYEAVRRAPADIRYRDEDAGYAQIVLYRNAVLGLTVGRFSPYAKPKGRLT